MTGKQEPPWIRCGQIHRASLKYEPKTGKKSVEGIKAALQDSLVCTLCVVLKSEKQFMLTPEMTNED